MSSIKTNVRRAVLASTAVVAGFTGAAMNEGHRDQPAEAPRAISGSAVEPVLNSCVKVVFTEGDTIHKEALKLAGIDSAEAKEIVGDDVKVVEGYERILSSQLADQGITDPTEIPLDTVTEVCQDLRIE